MDYLEKKLAIREEYKREHDMDVDVYFHNSVVEGLDLDSYDMGLDYNLERDGQYLGMFTHSGEEYFNRYGVHTYAVIVDREESRAKFNSRSLDPDNLYGNAHLKEYFLSEVGIDAIRQL